MTDTRRREKRLGVDSVVLPFLGSRAADYQTFEFLLQDVSGGVDCACRAGLPPGAAAPG